MKCLGRGLGHDTLHLLLFVFLSVMLLVVEVLVLHLLLLLLVLVVHPHPSVTGPAGRSWALRLSFHRREDSSYPKAVGWSHAAQTYSSGIIRAQPPSIHHPSAYIVRLPIHLSNHPSIHRSILVSPPPSEKYTHPAPFIYFGQSIMHFWLSCRSFNFVITNPFSTAAFWFSWPVANSHFLACIFRHFLAFFDTSTWPIFCNDFWQLLRSSLPIIKALRILDLIKATAKKKQIKKKTEIPIKKFNKMVEAQN